MTTTRTYKFNDLLGRHLSKPFSQYINTLRNKISDINAQLDSPAALDQYSGRSVPYAFTRLYGPFGLTDPLLVNSANYVLPRNGNIKVGRYGSFVWCETIITTYLSWTWKEQPAYPAPTVATFASNGDIFDDVVGNNGGAMVMQNNRYVDEVPQPLLPAPPNFCYELGLYDKLRGRYLHDRDRLPFQLFAGQNFTNKKTGADVRFDNNTEIEPRIYVTQLSMNRQLTQEEVAEKAWVKGYMILTFKGHLEQQEP